MNNKTEMYSAIEAEVPDSDDLKTFKNEEFLSSLYSFDRVCCLSVVISVLTLRVVFRFWFAVRHYLIVLTIQYEIY
jgi:hypothetical protein